MAALGAGDFRKPASGGPYAGESRDIIFEKKIKEKKDFIEPLKEQIQGFYKYYEDLNKDKISNS